MTSSEIVKIFGEFVCPTDTLLRSGANINLEDNRGYTPAHIAAQHGQVAFIYHMMVRWKVDIDRLDIDGRTPLHWACYKGFPDVVRLLLFVNARMDIQDRDGCTPLHWYVSHTLHELHLLHNSSKIASLLLVRRCVQGCDPWSRRYLPAADAWRGKGFPGC